MATDSAAKKNQKDQKPETQKTAEQVKPVQKSIQRPANNEQRNGNRDNRNNQRNGNRGNRNRPQLSREERIADSAKRLERKKEVISGLIDQNPQHTKLVTTKLAESQRLADAIDEIELGAGEVRMKMGSADLSWEDGQKLVETLNWAQSKVVGAVSLLNQHGFGVRNSVYEARQQKFTLSKHLNSTGSDELSVALRERANLEVKFTESEHAVMTKRIEEDKKALASHTASVATLDQKIAELRSKEAEAQRTARENEAKKKKEEHEARQKEAKEKKERDKKERQEAHQNRIKEQQEAKQKRLAEAGTKVETPPAEQTKDPKASE